MLENMLHLQGNFAIVGTKTTILDVAIAMNASPHPSYALVAEGKEIRGIFVAEALVSLVAGGEDLSQMAVERAIATPAFCLKRSQCEDLVWLQSYLRQQKLSYAPVVEDSGELLGVISLEKVERALSSMGNKQRTDCELNITNCEQTEIELQQERDFTTAILNTVGALVAVLDRQGRIVRFNHTCEQISGYRFAEVRQQPVWNFLIPPEEQAVVKAVFAKLLAKQVPNSYENHWLAKDGSKHLISWSNTALYDDKGEVEFIIATGIDVTEQRRIQNKLERQYRETKLLAEISHKIRMSGELKEILQTTVTEVQNLLICDRVIIVRLKKSGIGVPIGEAIVPQIPSMLDYELADPLFMGEHLARYCQGKFLAIDDIANSAIANSVKQLLQQFKIKAKLIVPILSQHGCETGWERNSLQGLLVAHQCDRPRQWQNGEIELLKQLADRVGVALAQAQLRDTLESRVKERTSELTVTNIRLQEEIEERQQAELKLQASQALLAKAEQIAKVGSWEYNLETKAISWSAELFHILGFPPSQRVPSCNEVLQRIHPDDVLLVKNALQQGHSQGIPWNITYRLLNYDFGRDSRGGNRSLKYLETRGEPTIDSQGRIIKVLGTVMDITERIKAEQSQRHSQEKLRLITDSLPILIGYIDREQHYRYNNQTYESWFGKPRNSLQGLHVKEVVGENNYQKMLPYIKTALAGDTVTFEIEPKDIQGNSYWANITYIPNIDIDGEVMGFFSMVNDITERKAIEQMKSEFVSIASHEMRTPLTSIHGVLKLLCADRLGSLSATGVKMTDIALRNADRLIRLINDVLDLERMESGRESLEKQPCNTADLIQQAIDMMQSMAEEHEVWLRTDVEPEKFLADSDRILQTLTNLIDNAIKFSSPQSEVAIASRQQDNEILFSVRDTGRGIPQDKLKSIFERFQQVDSSDSRKKGGTGLGLSICRHIVERHGGKIWVESSLEKGSTFFFTLPQP